MKLTFVTGNQGKFAVACEHLAPFGVQVEQVDLDLVEIQSHSVTQVAEHKARQAFDQLNRPLFVEDSGLFIDELRGWPGALTKIELATVGCEGIIRMADLTITRTARFHNALIYIDDMGVSHAFDGESRKAGTITTTLPKIANADPRAWSDLWRIFIPDGHSEPLSALPPHQREPLFAQWQATSHYAALGNWVTKHQRTDNAHRY